MRRGRRPGRERGQTLVEYVMIAGILTAVIIAVTKIVVPALGYVVVELVRHMAVFVSSVNP
jgi:Flp pilus assembly pilin Flp